MLCFNIDIELLRASILCNCAEHNVKSDLSLSGKLAFCVQALHCLSFDSFIGTDPSCCDFRKADDSSLRFRIRILPEFRDRPNENSGENAFCGQNALYGGVISGLLVCRTDFCRQIRLFFQLLPPCL